MFYENVMIYTLNHNNKTLLQPIKQSLALPPQNLICHYLCPDMEQVQDHLLFPTGG